VLNLFFANQPYLGIAQAVIAALLALVVMWVARWREIHLEKDIITAL